ncbi:hypothetical protein GLU60_02865 [Nanohaloarchaea archaeon H01]|nr:hypothetical protein [Nanohaloarchaea archaeon H01]
MGIETDGGDTWQYGDQKTYEDVLDYFDEADIDSRSLTFLRNEAEGLVEKFEEKNYLEPEGPAEEGPLYVWPKYFADESDDASISGDSRNLGIAFSVLDRMPGRITELKEDEETQRGSRYDATDVDWESLCGVLEAVTRIEDEDLD